ncbi:MAG: hypothetical protein JXA42_08660 [Anaerolineales bacterium]|nr:hypothetical protein [Anaerolineales bacterium]
MISHPLLVESCEIRRRYLYDCCRRLETIRSRASLQSRLENLPAINLSPQELSVVGQLAANITLQTTLWVNEPRLATAYLDCVENVHLLATAAPHTHFTANLIALVQSIPTGQFYRIVNLHMKEKFEKEVREWKLEMNMMDGALQYTDMILYREYIDSFELAAGPDATRRTVIKKNHEN